MLFNPANNLHNRQRQHRRQNSTPTAYEPVKVSGPTTIQRNGAHRRGISLDQRQRQTPPQRSMVSTNTNTGYTTNQQHVLRETQQQRLVRPGQGQQQYIQFDNDENYLHSPAVTPQRQSFDTGCTNEFRDSIQNNRYSFSDHIDATIDVDPSSFTGDSDFNLFSGDGALTPSAFLDFSDSFDGNSSVTENVSRRRSAGKRISGGIVDRVSRFEELALKVPRRPITPPTHSAPSYFPLTPVDTPHDRVTKHQVTNERFLDIYDTSMEETIKPRSSQRARGIFDDMKKEMEIKSMPSPPKGRQMSSNRSFDSAPMPTGNFMGLGNLDMEYIKSEPEFDESQCSPISPEISPALSYLSSPEMSQSAIFGDPFANKPSLESSSMDYSAPHGPPISNSPAPYSPIERSESVSSINVGDSITDTGITIDDIATYISGPDSADGKWLCLFPGCRKRFGRKENIKSHVQTHLGDRQFQCPHCQKCFVRQHDLKRHAKIHSGIKPYPCQCGNSFARHDALTRHRQRGMCIGAFEGVVKKTVKRGRPRKNRPDDQKRLEKSSRTRSKNKAMSSASSASEYTDSNAGTSPRSDLDVLDDKLFDGYQQSQSSSNHYASFQYLQDQFSVPDDYISPEGIQVHSPTTLSGRSASRFSSPVHHDCFSEPAHFSSHPASPTKSIHSYHSPPGLCDSSSSPAANNYYDFDTASNQGDDIGKLSLGNISGHEDDLFLETFSSGDAHSISTLERDPELLLEKFGDNFNQTNGDDIFRNGADVFFGSP